MSEIIGYKEVEEKVLTVRDQNVILDRDVAELYGVLTKDINRAVKNNPDKFPEGYVITLHKDEKEELVKNFHRFELIKHSTVQPSAFTEKGLGTQGDVPFVFPSPCIDVLELFDLFYR